MTSSLDPPLSLLHYKLGFTLVLLHLEFWSEGIKEKTG